MKNSASTRASGDTKGSAQPSAADLELKIQEIDKEIEKLKEAKRVLGAQLNFHAFSAEESK